MPRKRKVKTNLKRAAKDGKTSIVDVIGEVDGGTRKHDIQDPSERLIAVLGASMFNEPKYYPTDPQAQARGYTYNQEDFDDHAQLIINTAMEIAESDSPRDLLAIAHWARKEMKIRTTPQILLAVASQMPETKQYVRDYCKKVIQRADEIKQVFIASRALYGDQKSLPNSLKRGLADKLSTLKERDLLKYEGQHRPYFSDILKMVDRAKGWPLSKPLDHYLKTGEVTDEEATPIVAARKKLAKLRTFGPRAMQYAKASGAGWEVLISQFGNTKEVWETLIDSGNLPYMATLRNLRNLLEADVSMVHIKKVAKKLVQGATDSKQLPFRFLAARMAVLGQTPQRNYHYYNHYQGFSTENATGKQKVLLDAVDDALEAVVDAMDTIPGSTLIVVDNSGSMSSPISEKSMMNLNQAGSMLCAMFARKSEKAQAGGFGNKFVPATLNPKTTKVIDMANHVAQLETGHSTNAEDIIRWAQNMAETAVRTSWGEQIGRNRVASKPKKFDRIIILSDMQTYGGSYSGGDVRNLIEKYRKTVNKDCKLHCIDLAGHGRALTSQKDTKTNLVAGFSEKLMDTILEFEGLKTRINKEGEEEQVFTLEYVRENF
jgi:hypothetical protein